MAKVVSTGCKFSLAPDKAAELFARIKKLRPVRDEDTLANVMKRFYDYHICVEEDGTVINLERSFSNFDDNDIELMNIMAPLCNSGDYIDLLDDNNKRWRLFFHEGAWYKTEGRLVFPAYDRFYASKENTLI